MVGKLANQSHESGVQANRIREVNVEVQVHTSDIRRLDRLQEIAQLRTDAFKEQLVATLFEIREMREQQAAFDRHLMGTN